MSNEKCICAVLEEIDGFNGINEFYRFQKYIANLIDLDDLRRIPVEYYYTGMKVTSLEDNEAIKKNMSKYPLENEIAIIPKNELAKDEWYECVTCGTKWRLVYPDFPFTGFWEKPLGRNISSRTN